MRRIQRFRRHEPAVPLTVRFVPARLRSFPARLDLRASAARFTREVAACSAFVLVLGVAAVQHEQPPPGQASSPSAQEVLESRSPAAVERGHAPTESRVTPDLRPPAPAAAPVELPPAPPFVELPPPAPPAEERWLPTGTGMWTHEWEKTEGGSADAVVARAQSAGFSHLYVQTGSTKKGFIGDEVLGELLPATVGTDISVIAWDFPKLLDPVVDARRLVTAATWARPGIPKVAAVAPDVETAAEGTALSDEAVTRYYATLRAELPPEIAILATVPWPSEKRTGSYPYAETAPYSDAFAPMAYWYNREPSVVTATSMRWLARFELPVMPVGQGYDGRLDAPYLPEDPDPAGSVQGFVDAARAGGARSISLWSWQTTPQPQWDVLVRAGAASGFGAPAPDPADRSDLRGLFEPTGPSEPTGPADGTGSAGVTGPADGTGPPEGTGPADRSEPLVVAPG